MGNPLNPIPDVGVQPQSTHNLATLNPRGNLYNDPQGLRGSPVQSSIGLQEATKMAFYLKPIMEKNNRKRKFAKLARSVTMPKHMGKELRQTVYYPVLDDRNINDQGIDARGVQIRNGNIYGSSRDIGRIMGALPRMTEIGGRVNRIGFSRSEIKGTFNKFGLFFEYSDELLQFDTDTQLYQFMYSQALDAAEQISEDMLQIDLLNAAGTIVYAGNAISDATMNETSIITLRSLQRLHRALDEAEVPRSTKLIKGSANSGTAPALVHRTLFCAPNVIEVLKSLTTPWGQQAFKSVETYAASAGQLFEDEEGIIENFRIVRCDKMLRWEGVGAAANPAFGLSSTNGKYDIFPAICIGEDAFSAISFEGSTASGNNRFIIRSQKPAESISVADPYGEIGFTSIKWWYGILVEKPERIGLIKTVAPM